MKKNKLAGIILFGLVFLIASSVITFSGESFNSDTSCSCHAESGNLSVTLLNTTTVNINKGSNFTLSFYATTSMTGDYTFVIRILSNPTGTLATSPEMEAANSGIYDGSGGDPDGAEDDKIGNSTNPVNITIYNVPNEDKTFILTIIAADANSISHDKFSASIDVIVVVGLGGDLPETTWEWFMRTQLPILVGIFIFFGLGVFASFVLKKK